MIKVNHLNMFFRSELTRQKQHVLKDISFSVEKGQCLAIIGESGSGKSTLGKILIGLLKPSSGQYLFEGMEPYKDKKAKTYLSTQMSVVFQDYNTSVNPRFTVQEIIGESLKIFSERNYVSSSYKDRTIALLNRVGLTADFLERYPHQLSGGQLQRVCIARAIASSPQIILFDEAISSLDTHTQVQVMDLLKSIQQELNLTYIFITHDIMAVTYMCSHVLFLHNGQITENISIENLVHTKNPYAQALLSSVIGL